MSAVDALAVMGAEIDRYAEKAPRIRSQGESAAHNARAAELRRARAAVAELVDIKDCANSLVTGLVLGQVNQHHVAELCRLLGRKADISAALARCKGEGA